MMDIKEIRRISGQTMILLVIVIASVALTAMALSSFIVVSQLKQVTNSRMTGEAIFAADEGVECVLLHEFNYPVYQSTSNNGGESGCPTYSDGEDDCSGLWSGGEDVWKPISGGGSYRFKCTGLDRTNNVKTFLSVGRDKSGKAIRALEIRLTKE
ncbi:MAG: hypothetical protein PHP35_00625 [Candidatus Colwellbacteria bacterium]|nr:hypothetical protein [Candidatus Colwellbacteria bacterium]